MASAEGAADSRRGIATSAPAPAAARPGQEAAAQPDAARAPVADAVTRRVEAYTNVLAYELAGHGRRFSQPARRLLAYALRDEFDFDLCRRHHTYRSNATAPGSPWARRSRAVRA